MAEPIENRQPYSAIPVQQGDGQPCTLPPPGWACSKGAGHEPPCAASQVITEPPAADPPSPGVGAPPASAAVERPYGFPRKNNFEDDLDLPSGARVRYRKIWDGSELELELVELMDGFTPELLAAAQSQDEVETARALAKQDNREKVFGPINRIVVAAVICPTVVMDGPTTDTQINVKDIDMVDRLLIFNAAFGEQLARLKSVLSESQQGLRHLPAGQDIRPEAQ